MLDQIIPAARATIVLALLTGLLFPALVTVFAQMLFPHQANGSLVYNKSGQVLGSKLIGQSFNKPEYFHPRPSAGGFAGEASGGTNLGPTSKKLIVGQMDNLHTRDVDESFAGVEQLATAFKQNNLLSAAELPPVDAVTRSGSGLDPDISPANALLQSRRVAKARGLPLEEVVSLVKQHTQGRQFGFLGEPRVNVFMLNLALNEVKQ